MGLDIVVWANVRKSSGEDDGFTAFAYDCFKGRLAPLEQDEHYVGKVVMEFRAGSYSGYNAVRAAFCTLATGLTIDSFWKLGEDECVKRPLGELLNFADNEGVLGTDCCKRLAAQFDELAPRVGELKDTWFMEAFGTWQQACHLAAENNGAIMFC